MSNKEILEMLRKAVGELSPARRQAIDDMLNGKSDFVPMRQMHFGGSYAFDEDMKIVALEGEFSAEDLLRIAMVMK